MTRSDLYFKMLICCSAEYGLQRAKVDIGGNTGGCWGPGDLASLAADLLAFSAIEFECPFQGQELIVISLVIIAWA